MCIRDSINAEYGKQRGRTLICDPMSNSILLTLLALCAVPVLGYNQTLPDGNKTHFAVKQMSYGVHVFAVSKEGYIVHQVSLGEGGSVPPANATGIWQLLPNAHQGSTPSGKPQTYDSDPVIEQNDDGRLEILVRSHISLDFWHYYQVDAKDPYTWVGPREPACLCNFPPCEGQTRCGNNVNCGNDGYDCSAPGFENSGSKWWNTQAIFPTSDGTFVKDAVETKCGSSYCQYNTALPFPHEGSCHGDSKVSCSCENHYDANTCPGAPPARRLRAFFRGFDGLMYSVAQTVPGNSTKYSAPEAWGTLLE
eukprot:TRINITY_DN3558_c0_g2_i1.p1 TRINITY_DN3558_c0_g2~~TRINITY_DN3558_c0_g2_i1.p1  ORF type:complete len:308 (+),score=50.69 TRINITY_DN3558_c0_g2_i1:133-1056(+)